MKNKKNSKTGDSFKLHQLVIVNGGLIGEVVGYNNPQTSGKAVFVLIPFYFLARLRQHLVLIKAGFVEEFHPDDDMTTA